MNRKQLAKGLAEAIVSNNNNFHAADTFRNNLNSLCVDAYAAYVVMFNVLKAQDAGRTTAPFNGSKIDLDAVAKALGLNSIDDLEIPSIDPEPAK